MWLCDLWTYSDPSGVIMNRNGTLYRRCKQTRQGRRWWRRDGAAHPGIRLGINCRGPYLQICFQYILWSLKLHGNPYSSYFSHFNPAQLLLLSALPQPGQAESERQWIRDLASLSFNDWIYQKILTISSIRDIFSSKKPKTVHLDRWRGSRVIRVNRNRKICDITRTRSLKTKGV